jgi:hypothetical protein
VKRVLIALFSLTIALSAAAADTVKPLTRA